MPYKYIGTYTNKKYHFLNPSVEEICIEDISRALSMSCRYSGHVNRFYSVAEHSVIIANLVYAKTKSKQEAFSALLHDASEAYLTDIPRPIKPHLTNYGELEALAEKVIQKKFNVPGMSKFTKYLDTHICGAEAKFLFQTVPDWANDYDHIEIKIMNYLPKEANEDFMEAFDFFSEGKTY
jgi:hypothetical protein